MPTPKLETTDDKLLNGKVSFRQPAEGYRAAIDPVFLAAAVPEIVTGRVLDLGCGAGAALLCLARRRPDLAVVGLERDSVLADLARHNVEANGFLAQATIITGDLLKPLPALPAARFDGVIVNPPFLDPEAANASPNPRKAAATVESEAVLGDWAGVAARAVKVGGIVIFIHRADRLADLRAALDRAACGGQVIVPLWPRIGASPKRVIVLARRGDKTPAQTAKGVVLHEGERFTKQADDILREGAALGL
jgi:tRNA1(Val) A37 N6-methylase TrmN6